MRTAAGRRALQVALLVGGLFALGFVCGEQAHAADGVVSASATAVSSDSAGSVRSLTTGAVVAEVAHPPAEATTAKPVTPKVTAPKVTAPKVTAPGIPAPEGPAGTADVEVTLPSLPDLPDLPGPLGLPTLPSVPPVPSVPSAPGLPELPGLPPLPVHTLPVTVTPVPQPGSSPSPTPPAATVGQTSGERSDAAAPPVYGPWFTADAGVSRGEAHLSVHRATRPVHAPVHQEPSHDPGGALSGKSAVDSGTSRHGGGAHAVTVDHRAPLRLVPGAAVGVDAHGTRDRHRDIPVSPA